LVKEIYTKDYKQDFTPLCSEEYLLSVIYEDNASCLQFVKMQCLWWKLTFKHFVPQINLWINLPMCSVKRILGNHEWLLWDGRAF